MSGNSLGEALLKSEGNRFDSPTNLLDLEENLVRKARVRDALDTHREFDMVVRDHD